MDLLSDDDPVGGTWSPCVLSVGPLRTRRSKSTAVAAADTASNKQDNILVYQQNNVRRKLHKIIGNRAARYIKQQCFIHSFKSGYMAHNA